MMSKDQHQISLIDQTVNTLDGNIDTTTATDGLSIIDQWLGRLDDADEDSTDGIIDTLEKLRPEIDTAQRYNRPDNQRIATLLQDLIDQTRKIASLPETSAEQVELSQLISILENLYQQAANLQ